MPTRLTPPTMPLRLADEKSRFLANGLVLAYPLLEGGTTLRNHGSWGSAGDLTLQNTTHTRQAGLATLHFGPGASAQSGSINKTLPGQWSFVYWVKLDAAPSGTEKSILTLQGPSEAHTRAWADNQGIWSWQKYNTADAYSILPTSDFPTSNLMMVVAVYEGSDLPPAQLRTNQGFTSAPDQPVSYTAHNSGIGTQATTVNRIYLGNTAGGNTPLGGTLGPLYVWERPISTSEIWQLWQDPYAPFRRSREQLLAPSTMVSFSNHSLEGTGKSTSLKPIIQDDSALTISVQDYAPYAIPPLDSLLSEAFDPAVITVNDTYNYAAIPADILEADAPFSLYTITINDTYSYATIPVDSTNDSGTNSVPIITVNDTYNYAATPTDTILGDSTAPTTITINDSHQYDSIPTDTVTT